MDVIDPYQHFSPREFSSPSPSPSGGGLSGSEIVGLILLLLLVIIIFSACFHWVRNLYRGANPPPAPTNPPPTPANPPPTPPNNGLPQTVIDALPKQMCSLEDVRNFQDCSICLSEYEVGEDLRLLPGCSHAYHVVCIDQWLREHASCPLCRAIAVAACQ